MPRIRAAQPHRARGVGRGLGARTPPHPAPSPRADSLASELTGAPARSGIRAGVEQELDVVASGDLERHGAGSEHERVHAQRLPFAELRAHLVDGSDETTDTKRREIDV